jgi:hypothetical protein
MPYIKLAWCFTVAEPAPQLAAALAIELVLGS